MSSGAHEERPGFVRRVISRLCVLNAVLGLAVPPQRALAGDEAAAEFAPQKPVAPPRVVVRRRRQAHHPRVAGRNARVHQQTPRAVVGGDALGDYKRELGRRERALQTEQRRDRDGRARRGSFFWSFWSFRRRRRRLARGPRLALAPAHAPEQSHRDVRLQVTAVAAGRRAQEYRGRGGLREHGGRVRVRLGSRREDRIAQRSRREGVERTDTFSRAHAGKETAHPSLAPPRSACGPRRATETSGRRRWRVREWRRRAARNFRTPLRFSFSSWYRRSPSRAPSFGSARVTGEARGRRLQRERASGGHAARAGGCGAGLGPSPGIAVDTARDDRRVFPGGRARDG